jgi:hypothetical protein
VKRNPVAGKIIMRFQFPFIRKNDPQSVIVIVGLWICVATVAIIFILNFSARRKANDEKRAEVQSPPHEEKIHPHFSVYTHSGYSVSLHAMKQ